MSRRSALAAGVAACAARLRAGAASIRHRRHLRVALCAMMLGGVALFAQASAPASVPASRSIHAGKTRIDVELIGISDPARAAMLHRWVEEAARAARVSDGAGGLRFALPRARAVVREIDSRDPSPVPWAQTLRRDGVAVLFFVRRGATEAELRADWTAVHEFAHLAHPYLGDDGRWLAEGLASYHQNVLRARAGMLPAEEAWRRLDAGLRRGEAVGEGAPIERLGRGGTMRIYWAGAAFWLEAELALRAQGRDLSGVLAAYARCCLEGEDWLAPRQFLADLERAADVDVLLPLYDRHARMRAMPDIADSYAKLGIVREGKGIRFTSDARSARLRAAIMSPTPR